MHLIQKESRIEGLIEARDNAADSLRGQAARLLARLDQMYYEGSINDSELDVRNNIYSQLSRKDPNMKRVQELLNSDTAGHVLKLKEDIKCPWKARVERLTRLRGEEGKEEVSLLQQCAGNTWDTKADWKPETEGADRWSTFLSTLEDIKEEGDIHSYVRLRFL